MSNDQKKAYTIQRLCAANFNDMATLYFLVYGRVRPLEYFLKKYDTAYTGVRYLGYIAYNKEGIPVSYYGVIPTLLWCNARTVLAAQSADTMTHPKYRNSGLFTELAKLTFDLCRVEGVRVIFGFPNQNSFPGFINKLKWHMTDTMDRFTIPVKNTLPLERLAERFPVLRPTYSLYKKLLLKKHLRPQQGVANSVLADNHDGVFRDNNYFKYKSYSATQVIQIEQSTLWIKLRNGLVIGDISGIADNFDRTMLKLNRLAGRLGVQQIHFHASPNTPLHALFAERYQAIASYPVIFKDLGAGIPTENIKFTFADIDIF
jgi:hypothetical protein